MNLGQSKILIRQLVILCCLLLFSGNMQYIFSQAVTIRSYRLNNDFIVGTPITYCSATLRDTLWGVSPTGKAFGINGNPPAYGSPDPVGMINERVAGSFTGKAFIDLTLCLSTYGPTFTLTYQSNARQWPITLTSPLVTTLAAFPSYCANNNTNIPLSGGSPGGGYYKVNGFIATTFNPSILGAGTHNVYYYTGTGDCTAQSNLQTITVTALPAITFSAIPGVCINTSPFALTQASPAGGTYSGTGVSGGTFTPSVAGTGTHTITYTYSSGGCTSTATQTVYVSALPVVSFSGLDTLYCDTNPFVTLTGSVAGGGTGTFTGNGITDNGNNTAKFDPSIGSLGFRTITFSYTNIYGCSSSSSMQTRVGKPLTITGLNSTFCLNDANDNFTYNPIGGTFTALTGLTDNGDGTAVFSPSTNGTAGTKTVRYSLSNIYTCTSVVTQSVTINPQPTVNFSGLNTTGYCVNGSTATLTGNQAPGGTFSGPGTTNNGNGTATFNPTTLPVGGPYTITYTYTDPATGCSNSSSKTTNILPLPSGVISGTSTICLGTSATLDIDFTAGTGPFNFTYNDGVSNTTITGVADPYVLTVSPTVTKTYTLVSITAANGCTSTGSGSGTVTVTPHSAITAHPVSKTACPGDNVSFSVTATGAGLTYQWQLNTVNIPGATNNVLNLNNVNSSNAGSYRCVVSSTCGPVLTSSAATLTVQPQTAITTGPADKTICQGNNVSFTVVASGTGLSYQWKRNGSNLADGGVYSGVTTDNLTLTAAAVANAGNFSCTVSGTCGTATSASAVLTVNEPIVITTQPVNKSVCPGSTTSFSVAVTGTSPTYQWQLNNVNISGATSPTLTLTSVTSANAGNYKCIITGACGSVTSNLVQLEVYTNVSISQHPSGYTTCEGTSANFNVVAAGSGLSYQWQKNGINLSNGANISGVTTANLALTNLLAADGGAYTCNLTGTCGTSISNSAVLTVNSAIIITTQPVSKSVCPGSNTSFSVTVTGSNPAYQWQLNNVDISGATSSTLTLTSVTAANAGNYKCVITGSCGSVTSNLVQLVVYTAVSISLHPSGYTTCEGTTANFTVTAAGSGLSYQWQRNGTNLTNGANITGATSDNLTFSNLVAADAGSITCLVTGTCGNLTSNPAVLTVNVPIVITTQPASKSVCPGINTSFSVVVTGTNPTYQWQLNNTNIIGATNSTLTLTTVTSANAGNYKCIITGACGPVTSNLIQLIVYTDVSISTHPSDYSTCEGTTANLSVVAAGSNLSYQWQKNGTNVSNGANISGATTANLALSNLVAADGGSYTCIVTGTCGSLTSNAAALTVNKAIVITTQPVSKSACPGTNTSFSVAVTGTNPAYQWQLNNVNIPGATSPTLTLSSVNSSFAGNYKCIITGTCGIVTSNVVTLEVFTDVSISLQPSDYSTCEGTTANLNVVASGSNLTYQWQKNNTNISDGANITGTTTANLVLSNLTTGSTGGYACVVVGSCGTVKSTTAQLRVDANITITSNPANDTACVGDNVTLTTIATGSNLTYQWVKNGTNMTGETGYNLVLAAVNAGNVGIYYCRVTNACGPKSTSVASVSLYTTTAITTHPVDFTACAGTNANFAVTATGSNLTYRWTKNGAAISDTGKYAGTTSSNLSINAMSTTYAGVYLCQVSGACGNLNSNSALLTVNQNVVISAQPASQTACPGTSVSFSVTASGTNLSYQWQKNGSDISGATSTTLLLTSVNAGSAGSYRCKITGICGISYTNAATLSMLEPITISTNPASQQICEGNNVSFTVTANGSSLVYQWRKNGVNLTDGGTISGAQNSILSINNITLSDAGVYSCYMTNGCGISNTLPASLTVYPQTGIT